MNKKQYEATGSMFRGADRKQFRVWAFNSRNAYYYLLTTKYPETKFTHPRELPRDEWTDEGTEE